MTVDFNKIKEIIQKTDSIIFNPDYLNQVMVKGPSDYVTLVDKNVQNFLQKSFLKLYPEIEFMGEEKDNSDLDFYKNVWIIDPIDGTANLIHDCRFSAVSVALWNGAKQKIELGIIYHPFTKDIYHAIDGQGAYLNGVPIHVSTRSDFKDCIIATGTAPYYKECAEETMKMFYNMFLRCSDIRRSGCASLDLAYVASGKLEGYVEKVLSPWDFAAGLLILQEAGGRITDYSGNPISGTEKTSVCCSNGIIHDKLLEVIQISR